MATITITITLDVPDGTQVAFDTGSSHTAGPVDETTGLSTEVQTLVERYVPKKYREHTIRYLNACVDELDCVVEVPAGDRQHQYLNIFPPPRCRRARVAGLTYSSTRTALFTGAIDLGDFHVAEETKNNGVYAHPKVAHLNSDDAVTEALELTRRAIARVER